MTTMVEMTAFSPKDTSTIRRNMEREGYALLRGFFDPEDMRDAVAAFERVLSSHGWIDASREPGQAYISPGVFHLHSSKEFYDLQYDFYLEQAVHKVVHHEKLKSFFRSYFQEEAILHPNFYPRAVFTAPPTLSYYPTPKHQDFPVFQGSPNTITCWLVFNNCPRENGPLIVSPSSHTEGVHPYNISENGGMEISGEFDNHWASADLQLGDLLIFSCYTVHKALPNTKDYFRISIDLRYQPVSEVASDECFSDKMMFLERDWSEVYDHLDDESLCYYWKDKNLELIPYNPRFQLERELMVLQAAKNGDQRVIPTLEALTKHASNEAVAAGANRLLSQLLTASEVADHSKSYSPH